MKTIREWFGELPSPVRERAFKNTSWDYLEFTVTSLNVALLRGFVWDSSNEGFEYWRQVYDSLPALP